jgi:hypothetical protein
MVNDLSDNYEIPDNYKKIVLVGYFSIFLFFLPVFLNLIFNVEFNSQINYITCLFAVIFIFYFIIKLHKLKGIPNVSIHYTLVIMGFCASLIITKYLKIRAI